MRLKRFRLVAVLILFAILGTLALRMHAQDTSILRPPKGAKVALIVFEDLECPSCSRDHMLLVKAANTYKIPLVRYDFPLPQHTWAWEAAVLARYFDAKKLGDEYRNAVFQHQLEITKDNLHAFSEKFATDHNVILPFAIDPQGKLAEAVKADRALGERVGINHTPTIYVATNSRNGQPYVEVTDINQLYQIIDAMKDRAQ